MKVMAGVVKPDKGKIEYNGLSTRDITMVLRKPYLLHDTVFRNLVYPLKIRKIKPDKTVIEHYLEIAGLTEYRNEYAPGLSSGEQQKLALIRALIFKPKMIFIDEIFSNMDIESVAFFEDYILKLQNENPITWVFISHQLSTIRRLCEYTFFMSNGSISTSGATEELLTRSDNEELNKFLKFI